MNTSEMYTTNDAIEALGFHKFQWRLMFLCGIIWMFEAVEIYLSSLLGPYLLCFWNISSLQLSILSTSSFLGIAIGSLLLGKLTDLYGRKKVIFASLCFMLYYGLLTSAAPNFILIVILKGLYGVFLSSTYQVFTLMMEYCTAEKRSTVTVIFMIPWTAGTMMTVLLAATIEPTLGWRIWLVCCTFPIITSICFYKIFPESLRYLSTIGDKVNLTKVLENILIKNKRSLPPGELNLRIVEDRGALSQLFSKMYYQRTFLLTIITFSANVAYYGLVFVQPVMLTNQRNHSNENCQINCQSMTFADYMSIIIASASEFAGFIFCPLIHRIRRRPLFGIGFFIAAAVDVALIFTGRTNELGSVLLFSLSRAVSALMFPLTLMYASELYPTKIRGIALGYVGFTGKIGSMVAPLIAQGFYLSHPELALVLLSLITALGIISIVFLPETKDSLLQDTDVTPEN